jgi:hypothetical protein
MMDTRYLIFGNSAIRLVSPELDRVWTPMGGEPIVGRLGQPLPGTETVSVGVKAHAD